MTEMAILDRARLRSLFDLRGSYLARTGGSYETDPYPAWHRLRETGPVHEGTVHELTGVSEDLLFAGLPFPDRRHFSVFSWAACDAAYRNPEVFASSPDPVDLNSGASGALNSMLSMGGAEHRRYRALVQPSFVPNRAEWWIHNWIERTVHLLIDGFLADGRAELNVDFCAAIPVLTITSSFGVPVEQALDIRASIGQPAKIIEILRPIVAARREEPRDDLISVLVQAEITDEDGTRHRLSDAEVFSFSLLLLIAGSGTTWKQMGITLTALLQRPEVLAAVREDRALLRPAIEESLRWMPTDPMFARYATRDIDFHGTHIPEGSVLHICLAAANRDPARWGDADTYDIHRQLRPSFAFGGGPHICLGMHVARAEIRIGIGALLDRLPNLRLDPDAEQPHFVGMYERGATAIPVLFG
ncbi:cytochrome P450 [Frankia sp. AgB1.9]|uniref:cytochrome P450 n=1 Tax=unclassified Frankia TaxID=2632575 RepID=UPI0019344E07|nr:MULTISPECIES: cytochrome P450 [unclassified Frankia]MBL7488835.1 cytochrome P450 [Frankia sp. AgW1.1]MBL7546479.1 cytochrome P450 [Frankia sp. AgB1.9]MBL7620262.1 cytochrome P450 [Frankia sp. AgB1.8]